MWRAALLLPLCALLLLAGAPITLSAQRPAELTGRIHDPARSAVEGAAVELVESGERTLSDALGRYRFRSLSAGRHTLRVTALGYHARATPVEVEAGRAQQLDVELVPAPLALGGVAVTVPTPPVGSVHLEREAIERSGARSAGEVLRDVPGVIVRSASPGGPLTASVRGGAADALLVLVDGVVLNDPVTGEADLSTVAAASLASLTLLPGGQSARYGPRAEAGVLLLETRRAAPAGELRGAVGALGARSASLLWGGSRPFGWSAGGEWSALEGAFDFDLPEEAGGGSGRRSNAAARTVGFWAGASARLAGGDLAARASFERSRRGLPGRSYAPSPHARQAVDRLQGSANWRREQPGGGVGLTLAASRHGLLFQDPDPPFGLPYQDSARVAGVDLLLDAERRLSERRGLVLGAALEGRWQALRTTTLDAGAPRRRSDLGLKVHTSWNTVLLGERVQLEGAARLDRDSHLGWTASRALTVASSTWLGLETHLSLRSSYSPPSLADQHFRDAVGVGPNPELTAERVPWEVEAGARVAGRAPGDVPLALSVTAYRGDVRGMIVWAPDFRFVWSPRNVDVRRAGIESRAQLGGANGRLGLALAHSYTRVVYDRAAPEPDVQVVYRPRHAGWGQLDARLGAWQLDLDVRFTGARNPVPAAVNVLPAYWTSAAGLTREWALGGWTLRPSLRADRLFGERPSLIFGFPEPGRTLRLDVSLRPRTTPLP